MSHRHYKPTSTPGYRPDHWAYLDTVLQTSLLWDWNMIPRGRDEGQAISFHTRRDTRACCHSEVRNEEQDSEVLPAEHSLIPFLIFLIKAKDKDTDFSLVTQ